MQLTYRHLANEAQKAALNADVRSGLLFVGSSRREKLVDAASGVWVAAYEELLAFAEEMMRREGAPTVSDWRKFKRLKLQAGV